MDAETMQHVLEEVHAAYQEGTPQLQPGLWLKMHTLAEAGYLPAKVFFQACLDDPREKWRDTCLKCLGFHYPFSPDSPIAEKVRALLLHDPDGFVRLSAAGVLGLRSQWPDPILVTAMQSDPDEDVRLAAFGALLHLRGILPFMLIQEKDRMEAQAIEPSMEELERILARRVPYAGADSDAPK